MPKPRFRQLPEIYEPSACQQLPDGRVLVLEDEAHRPFSLLTFDGEKNISRRELWPETAGDETAAGLLRDMADLEAMDADERGHVYVITSHSRRDKDGKRPDKRCRLLRFHLDGDVIGAVSVAPPLLPALLRAHPELQPAADEKDVKRGNGLNIEGMAFDAGRDRLLIGFRSPLMGKKKKAVIATVTNPEAVFAKGVEPEFSQELITLDLDGGGIRGMDHVAGLGGYLLVSGRAGGKEQPFRLWYWSGDGEEDPSALTIKGLKDLNQAEGITPLHLPGGPALLIVSDDGDEKKTRGAGYVVVDHRDIDGLPEG